MVPVVVQGILGADLHRHDARDPRIIFCQDLVALWGHVEGADVALRVATRLAIRVWFHKDRTPVLLAGIFNLVGHGREDRSGTGWDLNLFWIRTRRVRDLDLQGVMKYIE